MLQFELLVARTPFSALSPTTRQLPLYVEPAAGEALVSWLQRLATRLGVSMGVLVGEGFGLHAEAGGSQWWRRPRPWTLKRISDVTGVPLGRLRGMTLEQCAPVYRDDESSERFSQRRFTTRAPESRSFRFVACLECFRTDAIPYLRLPWTLGWLAICTRHHTIMTTRCESCRAKLRLPRLSWVADFSPLRCSGCHAELQPVDWPVDACVLRFQDALLRGKQEGVTDLPGIGRLTWPELIALADVLVGMFWTDGTSQEQLQRYGQFTYSCDLHWLDPPSIRYANLVLFAWLTQGWPTGFGPELGHDLLGRWLDRTPNRISRHLGDVNWKDPWSEGPHDIEPKIRERLQGLLSRQRRIQSRKLGPGPETQHQSSN